MAVGCSDGWRAFRSQSMRHCLRRQLELRGPRRGLKIGTRGVHSAQFPAQMPSLPMKLAGGRTRGVSRDP
eukprot:4426763-Alexandrium_andersonii.AAC.1